MEKAEQNKQGAEQSAALQSSNQELHQSLLLLSAILESTADGLMVVDNRGCIVRCNRRFLEIWNLTEDYGIAGPPDDIIRQVRKMIRAGCGYQPLNEDLQEHESEERAVRLELKDGRIIERVTRPLKESDGRVVGRVGSYRDVSERIRAEERLQEERKRFLKGPVVVFKWRLGSCWPVEYVSPNVTQEMGWPAEILLRREKCFCDLIHEDDLNGFRERIAAHRNEGQNSFQEELRILCADNEYRWFYTFIMAELLESGEIAYYQGYLLDISRRKAMEIELIRSEQRWQFALEGSGSGVWDWEVQTGEVFFTKEWRAFLGYRPDELSGRIEQWRQRVHPDDWQMVQMKLELHLLGLSDHYEAEYRLRCRDGSYKWVQNRGMVVSRDAGNRALRMIGTQLDISERRQAEEMLRESEKNFRCFFNGIDDMVFVVRDDGEILFANETAGKKSGYSQAEMKELHILNLFPSEEQGEAARLLQAALDDAHGVAQSRVIDREGRLIPVECRVVRGRWSDAPTIFIICKDISELELERSKFRKAFEASSSAMAISKLENSSFLELNEAFCHVFGYSREEALGKSSLELGLIKSEALRARIVARLEDKKNIRNQEIVAYAKDGSPRYGVFSADCIELVGEKYLLMTFVDMTEQRRVQDALRQQSARLTSLLDSVPDMIFFKDLEGRYLGCNAVFAERLHKKKEDVIGLTDNETSPGEKGIRYRQHDRQVIESGQAMLSEMREEGADGSSVVIETLRAPLREQNGTIIGVVGMARDISERKMTEDALSWSQSLLSQMATSSPLGFYVINTHNDNILYFNQRFCEIWRLESLAEKMAEGILRHKDINAFCSETLSAPQAFSASMARLQQERNREILQEELFLKDGRVIRQYSTQIRDETDHYWGRLFIYEDVTSAKEAERKLLEALEFQKGIMAAATIGIAAYDWQGQCLMANESIASIIGARREQVLAQNFRRIESWKECGLLELVEKTFISGPQRQELYVRTSYGRECWLDVQTALFGSEENPMLLVVANDITARKETQLEIERHRTRQQAILDNLPSAAWLKDKSGCYEMVNNEHARLCGLPIGEIIGKTDEMLWPAEKARTYVAEDQDVMQKRSQFRVEEEIKGRWYVTYKTPIFNEKGEVVGTAGLSQDISERKRYEEALKEAKEAAEAANRAKSEFLANMSHEIRTPMNGIVGMTELALATELSELQREYLGNVQHSAFALLDILNDILDFSKIEAGKMELDEVVFDWRGLLEKEMTIFSLKCQEKNIELLLDYDPGLPRFVIGDPVRIRQVLVNLLGNAVKFTNQGEIIVAVDYEPSQDERGKQSMLLTVSDTGIGISPSKIEMIFDGFTQADGSMTRRYGGTGLGLTISRNLVRLMGGEISVKSETGKGSSFCVRLPLEVAPQEGGMQGAAQEPGSLAAQRILVVDDNMTNRRILKDMLEHWKMEVRLCDSGTKVVALLEAAIAAKDPYSIILLDVQMPEMDGWQVVEAINRAALPVRPEVLLLSSALDTREAERCRILGVNRYLMKPVRMADLYRVMAGLGRIKRVKEKEAAPPEAAFSGKVLVAEDEPVNMMIISTFLTKQGLTVVKAKNGAEALLKFRQGDFDLIFMDLHMPELDGLEATRCIRQLERGKKRLPIIALTADAMKGDREKCLSAGMDHYVAKPFRQEELQAVLRKYLKQVEQEGE